MYGSFGAMPEYTTIVNMLNEFEEIVKLKIRNNATSTPKWKQVLINIGWVFFLLIALGVGYILGYITAKIPIGGIVTGKQIGRAHV